MEEAKDLAHDAVCLIRLEEVLCMRGSVKDDQLLRVRARIRLQNCTAASNKWSLSVNAMFHHPSKKVAGRTLDQLLVWATIKD